MKIASICVLAMFKGESITAFAPTHKARVTTNLAISLDPSISSGAQAFGQDTTVAAIPKVSQRWRKSTKQLATLGPASSTLEMIETLFLAGADIFRLNFSHGSQEQKKELLTMIRQVEEKYSHPIAVLGDLQGPKLRVSYSFFGVIDFYVICNHHFHAVLCTDKLLLFTPSPFAPFKVGEFSNPNGEILEKGQHFRLDLDEAQGDSTRVMLPHPEIIDASEVGHVLLVDDGKVKLVVVEKGDSYLECRVDVPGKISNRKVRVMGHMFLLSTRLHSSLSLLFFNKGSQYPRLCIGDQSIDTKRSL